MTVSCPFFVMAMFALGLFPGDMPVIMPLFTSVSTSILCDSGSAEKSILNVNVTPTYGPGGAKRPTMYLLGDRVYANMRITGLKLNSQKEVNYSLTFDLYDKAGDWVANLATGSFQHKRPFFLSSVSGRIESPLLGPNLAAGEYKLSLKVRDNLSLSSAVNHMIIGIYPESVFGATNIQYCQDSSGERSCDWCIPLGTPVYLRFLLTGYKIQDGRIRVISSCTALRNDTGMVIGQTIECVIDTPSTKQCPHWTSINVSGLPPGRYLLRLCLEDQLAREEAERNGISKKEVMQNTRTNYRIPLLIIAPSEKTPSSTIRYKED